MQLSCLHNLVVQPQASLGSLAKSSCSAQGLCQLCWVPSPSYYRVEALSRLSPGTIIGLTLLVHYLSDCPLLPDVQCLKNDHFKLFFYFLKSWFIHSVVLSLLFHLGQKWKTYLLVLCGFFCL